MSSLGEEITLNLKKLFMSKACPKTANLKWYETESIVFVSKNIGLSFIMKLFVNKKKCFDSGFMMVMSKITVKIDLK